MTASSAATAPTRAQKRQLAVERRRRRRAYEDRVLRNHPYYAALARYGIALQRLRDAVAELREMDYRDFVSEADDDFGYSRLHLDVIVEDCVGILWTLQHLRESWASVSVLTPEKLAALVQKLKRQSRNGNRVRQVG